MLSLHLDIGKQAKRKSKCLKDARMLLIINCDITKAANNVTVDSSFIHKKWRMYLVTLKDFFENILLQDTVIDQTLYLIIRYPYLKRKISCYKIFY